MTSTNPAFAVLIALALAGAAQAQTPADARTFVEGLYRGYQTSKDPDYLGKGAPQVFSPRFVNLLRQDQARAPDGEAGTLDWDPICDCQDYEGLAGLSVDVGPVAKGRTRADVHFRLGEEMRALRLELVAVQGHWRVDDVSAPNLPSVAGLLLKAR